jgi:hypothetical protein
MRRQHSNVREIAGEQGEREQFLSVKLGLFYDNLADAGASIGNPFNEA